MQMISWDADERAALPVENERPGSRTFAIAAVVTWAAFAVGGLLAAVLWAWFADPPYAVVVGDNAYRGAAQLSQEFGIDVAFASACLVVVVPLGAAVGLVWHRVGWPLAVALVLAAGVTSVIAWQLGGVLGPEDPLALIATASDGDRLYQPLEIHAKGLFLTAPVGALVGFIAAVALVGDSDRSESPKRRP